MPSPTPSRKGSSANWDSENKAPTGESADEKLRRLQMQMASGTRAGVKPSSGDPAAAKPKRKIGELVIIAFASVALVAGLITATIAVLKKPQPVPVAQPSTPATAPDTAPEAGSETAEKDHRWLKSDSDEAKPYVDLLNKFFAAPPEAKKDYFEPFDQLDARLAQHADSELLQQLPPQRFAKNVFIANSGIVAIDTNITGHGFRPIVLLPTGDGTYKIDFDSYIGHIDFDWAMLLDELAEKKSLRIRVLLKIDRNMTAKVPGDVILEFRNPSLEQTYHAHLSILDVPETHIVKWLNAGVPLPFTATLVEENSLYGKILRIEKIEANAWFNDRNGRTLAIAP